MKSVQKSKDVSFHLFVYLLIVFLLLLTSININNYLAPKKVLGVEAQEQDAGKFWQEFVKKNPDYAPGWVELGRVDKVKEIDPNFISDTSDLIRTILASPASPVYPNPL
jgi:hypothetical protein